MDKKPLVIMIAIGTIVITTMLQFFIRGRQLSPAIIRLLWGSFVAGVVVLMAVVIFMLTR